ncbi:amino acid ABC transporter permease [Shinella sp. NM-101]|uniref:amino acid ABC transporter permease n=1 Tax=Shinella sp. NM-101 TaxID=2744455 RepID=UPI001F385AC4|nr:amino acid ABC transporter permease [Shinella sp. NM-101]
MTWSVLSEYRDLFVWSIWTTFQLAVISWIVAVTIALVMSVMRTSQNMTLRFVGAAYVEFFRNVPPLVIIFVLFFAFPQLGIRLSNFASVVWGVGLYGGAMMTEFIRSGIESLPRGQFESAISSGMSRGQAMRYVILPQAISIVVPPLGSETINIIKNTSLGAAISMTDVLGTANLLGARTFAYDVVFLAAGSIYLLFNIPTAAAFKYFEARTRMGR